MQALLCYVWPGAVSAQPGAQGSSCPPPNPPAAQRGPQQRDAGFVQPLCGQKMKKTHL